MKIYNTTLLTCSTTIHCTGNLYEVTPEINSSGSKYDNFLRSEIIWLSLISNEDIHQDGQRKY